MPLGASGNRCACERHMRMFCEAVGEEIQREQLPGLLFCGGENKYRGAWMKIMGDSLLDFARKLRCALDKEFPQVRMGFCSGFTSWDLEGVDAITLTKALAGNTKPFLRLMGAPYWVTTRRFDRQSLQNIIEHVRLQETWCENQGVEIFSEADCYPRPRNQVPAAQTECFESALRVEGIEGGLKYMLDYVAPPLYETGYVERHLNNLPVTTALESLFQNKEMEGIRVYEYMREIEHKDYPQKFIGEWELMTRIFKRSQTILSYNAIPTKYKGGGVGICFGESAKYVEKSAVEGGLILDMPAAKILRQRGFDTGFLSASPVEGAKWEYENGVCFHMVEPQVTYFQTELKPQATVHSCFVNDAGSFPGLYTYRGKDGCRFAVLAFDADTVPHHSNLLTSYLRQRQLAKCYEFLCGKKLPACTYQNPGMYLLCSKKDGALSVGLWNLHEDIAFSPKIYLGESYKEITCVHCSGKLQGDQVTLSDIPPYGFCGFEVK